MKYSVELNSIMKQYSLSAKAISGLSGVSTSAISRYRNSERKPDNAASLLIINAILRLIQEQGVVLTEQEEEDIRTRLCVYDKFFRYDHFDSLISVLGISMTELSNNINYSLPYLSSIRSGKHQPADRKRFLAGICSYLRLRCKDEADRKLIFELAGINDLTNLEKGFEDWLWSRENGKKDSTGDFLKSLDSFDLGQYTMILGSDSSQSRVAGELPAPCRAYLGTEEMRRAELDFFYLTLNSDSTEPVFMYNEMAMTDMAKDENFGREWMRSIGACLKKGLQIEIIHDLDRPAEEMLLGLMLWIPLYMSGNISPYCLKSPVRGAYRNTLYLSGAACLTGSSVSNEDAGYSLRTSPEILKQGLVRKEALLKSAQALMDIYTEEKSGLFHKFQHSEEQAEGERLGLNSTIPFYTFSEGLLTSILKRNNFTEEEVAAKVKALREAKGLSELMLSHSAVTEVVPELTEEEFNASPLPLDLTDSFGEKRICYSYGEYKRHLELTKNYSVKHNNYQLILRKKPFFNNIRLRCRSGEWVVISKANPPVTHFVIRHPKLIEAIEKFCTDQIGVK